MFLSVLQSLFSIYPPYEIPLLIGIFLPVAMVPFVLIFSRWLGHRTGYLAVFPALISFLILLGIFIDTGGRITADSQPMSYLMEFSWIPSIGINLEFLIDGLSLFYGLVISGVGVLVCWYAALYLGKKYKDHGKFYAYLMLFVTAMLGVVFSNNLLLMFTFWEITSVTSFMLIGFFHTNEESRLGARRALLVTALTGLCMLAGLIMMGLATGTYSFHEIREMRLSELGYGNVWLSVMFILIMLGAFGKSAQFPFFFWLPGAMVAPTPVSTYLHSATMVKLGVFLTARMYPVLSQMELWFPVVVSIAFVTMLLGAWLALRSNDLKAILAYSTISQLGLLIGIYGLGSSIGVRYDFLHIMSHVLYKGSLFMIVGIVDHCTGTRDVRALGGLMKRMPLTGILAAVGLAALAGVPLTISFISKETLLTDLLLLCEQHAVAGPLVLGAVLLSTVMLVVVAIRIFAKVFLGNRVEYPDFHKPGLAIQLAPLVLISGVLLLGIFPGVMDQPLAQLQTYGVQTAEQGHLALWHGFNTELMISLGLFVLAGLIYLWAQRTRWAWTTIPRWLQFARAFDEANEILVYWAKRVTHMLKADFSPAYLPIVITFLLVAMGGVVATFYSSISWDMRELEWSFHPLRTLLVILISVALLAVVIFRRWSAQLVALSVAGFFITFYFVLYRAPDLAMTQVLVESASVVMILFLLSRFPSSSQIGMRFDFGFEPRHIFRLVVSLGVGILMGALVMFADLHRHPDPVGERILELTVPLAEGTNAVNAILVDFRGFDTMGEITVLLVATLGGLGLMMRYKRGRNPVDPKPLPGLVLEQRKKK